MRCTCEIERDAFGVKEIIEMWGITCELDMINVLNQQISLTVYLAVYLRMLYVLCENMLSNTL